ncbi:hypothetical protein IMCC14465_12410 [alpha proteobacterium IMCC14465]|uniref:Crossover junction endodeoxyribonuclease RuvC n=1 Tax=alpha proteobacterium IMCC14465 TaxID=1220535 RepID=J9A4Y9_9PROT|nr:hypothetical protein IMCC14465_12410 [alpha proteobacterium IMCC14465]
MTQSRRLIGLDPGLRNLGWGVIDVSRGKLVHIANGTISSNAKDSLADRLVQLMLGLEDVVDTHQPNQAAVENSFVNKDGAATLKLGQARAVCLIVPARKGLKVFEYAPNFIKRSVTGAGHADKHQINAMVKTLLPQAKPESEHAADALAIAITHAHAGDLDERLSNQAERLKVKS